MRFSRPISIYFLFNWLEMLCPAERSQHFNATSLATISDMLGVNGSKKKKWSERVAKHIVLINKTVEIVAVD